MGVSKYSNTPILQALFMTKLEILCDKCNNQYTIVYDEQVMDITHCPMCGETIEFDEAEHEYLS